MNLFEPVSSYYVLTFATSSVIMVLAAMLAGMHIPPDEKLSNLRSARFYLSLSYLVLGISGFFSFFIQRETEDKMLLASSTLVIASYQALLFTYTILALIQPLYVKRRMIVWQLAIITAASALLLAALLLLPHSSFLIVFAVAVTAYFFQITFYTHTFRSQYKVCLNSLEKYYEEDEKIRLRWTRFGFYSALAVGILALVSLFMDYYFYALFSVIYTIYYAYMAARLYNYQIDFQFAIPVITQREDEEKPQETVDDEESARLAAQSEQFRRVLARWVADRKFTETDISVEEIAQSLGVSRSFLQYYFRTYMQTDFRIWRSGLRIEEAQSILRDNPGISLENVRELVGFNHRANFHQQFQKITGLTPTEYREQYLKQP